MACNKCHKRTCNGECSSSVGGNSTAQTANMAAQLAVQQDQIQTLTNALQPFLTGHPILALENADDINQFDLGSGIGTGTWLGWGVCNGSKYTNPNTNKQVSTPDLIDRCLVQSQGEYAIDDVGGNDKINLTVGQLPVHNHGITDTGHTHIIIDHGHDHGINDQGHTHGGTASAHVHTFTTDHAGSHNHTLTAESIASSSYHIGTGTSATIGESTITTSTAGDHYHTGTTDAASSFINTSSSYTGILVENAYTGISNQTSETGITVNNTGNGDQVDVRQPYYAVLYVMKIY